LRDKLFIPVPKILEWSSDANNAVCAEYIIEELALGVALGSLWTSMAYGARTDILAELVDIESRLTSASFKKSGSIYFKEDLKREGVAVEDLSVTFDNARDSMVLNQFTIGPSTQRRLWDEGRAEMDLDRGPCKRAHDLEPKGHALNLPQGHLSSTTLLQWE